jgi:hypothetical protein
VAHIIHRRILSDTGEAFAGGAAWITGSSPVKVAFE